MKCNALIQRSANLHRMFGLMAMICYPFIVGDIQYVELQK
jgi:hypothetical protein